jgi:hypothetical protein
MFKYASHFATSSRVHKYIFFCQSDPELATSGSKKEGHRLVEELRVDKVCKMNRSLLALKEQSISTPSQPGDYRAYFGWFRLLREKPHHDLCNLLKEYLSPILQEEALKYNGNMEGHASTQFQVVPMIWFATRAKIHRPGQLL